MSHQFFFSPHILDNLIPPVSGFDVVQDISEPRLRLYTTSRGIKTFFTRKRVGGRDVRLVIGRYPDITIDAARAEVNRILANARKPRPQKRKKITFQKLSALYVNKKIRRTAPSLAKLMRNMDRMWAGLYPKNIDDITPDDLAAVNRSIAENSGPTAANRMLEILRSIFKFAIDAGYLKQNPVTGIQKARENRRTMPLTFPRLRALIRAIEGGGDLNIRGAFLMLVYGFESKSKIFKMQWRDLDFNGDMWGNRPLSDAAVVLLRDMPQDGKYVFVGRVRTRPLSDPRESWRRIAADAGVPDVKMDDVHKFLKRHLEWSPNRETLRQNMNNVLNQARNDDDFPSEP